MPPQSSETWRRFVDDAAMFPPGNASPSDALADHLRFRRSWFADLVGPLLVPAVAWDDFVAAHAAAGRPSIEAVLIGARELPSQRPQEVTVGGFEVPVGDVPLPPVPAPASLAAEVTLGEAGTRVIREVTAARRAGRNVVAKFRSGGTTPEAFPAEAAVASFIVQCVTADVPFKLTAGLHHALRHSDPVTGFEHHGFLNVLVATASALDGLWAEELEEILAIRDAGPLVDAFNAIPDPAVVRRNFVSFGCCGVEDPVNDLVRLGLVVPEAVA